MALINDIVRDLKACDLDCADWDESVLYQLAEIVLGTIIDRLAEGSDYAKSFATPK